MNNKLCYPVTVVGSEGPSARIPVLRILYSSNTNQVALILAESESSAAPFLTHSELSKLEKEQEQLLILPTVEELRAQKLGQ